MAEITLDVLEHMTRKAWSLFFTRERPLLNANTTKQGFPSND